MSGERPKRPLSAYMLWLNENRESIKKENPGSKVTDIAKRGGELWRGLKDKTVSKKKQHANIVPETHIFHLFSPSARNGNRKPLK